MTTTGEEKKKILTRLRRIEGQTRGIQLEAMGRFTSFDQRGATCSPSAGVYPQM